MSDFVKTGDATLRQFLGEEMRRRPSAAVITAGKPLPQRNFDFSWKAHPGHAFHPATGSTILNTAPDGVRFSAVMSPPWARATARAKLSPRPAPGSERLGSPR